MDNSQTRIKLKKSKVFNDGYGYIVNRVMTSSDGRLIKYLKCQDLLCRATAKIIDGEYQDISTNHNHAKNDSETKKIIFKDNLKLLIQTTTLPVKECYNNIASTDPTGALHCPMEGLVSSMRRWRKEGTCAAPKPHNLVALGDCLEAGSWKHISRNYDGVFYAGLVSVDNQHALFFGNPKFISSTFTDSHEVFIDVSYRLAPRDPYVHQLVTIFAVTHEIYIFPIIYVLMESDSETLYETVFNHLKSELAPNINPKFIVCPYENKLFTALRSVYTQSNIHGSFYHYVKAIYSKARALGITSHLDDDEVSAVLNRYYTVPLLPYNLMQEAFDELRAIRPDMFLRLWHYISNNWFAQVAVVHMCVFGQPHRTHSFWTNYNVKINQPFEDNQPEMSKLIGELKKIHTLARTECKRLKDGKNVEKMIYRIDDLFHSDLKEKWCELSVGNITIADFKLAVNSFAYNEHCFFSSYGVDEDISIVQSLPSLRNTLFRPHACQM